MIILKESHNNKNIKIPCMVSLTQLIIHGIFFICPLENRKFVLSELEGKSP